MEMMKAKYMLLFLLLCAGNMLTAQTGTDSNPSHAVSIVGVNSFGVLDCRSNQLIIDSVYQSIDIYDGPIIYCSTNIYWNNGVKHRLPASVVDIFNGNGRLISHEFDALLAAETPPYSVTIDFAKAKGYKDLEAYAKFLIGADYQKEGLRREAFQYYTRAYKLNPNLTIAKTYADDIKDQMTAEVSEVAAQIWREDRLAEIAAAERKARYEAMAAAFNQLGSDLAQAMSKTNTPQQSAVSSTSDNSKTQKTQNKNEQDKCIGMVSAFGISRAFGDVIDHRGSFQVYQDKHGYYIMNQKYPQVKDYLNPNHDREFLGYPVGQFNYRTISSLTDIYWFFKL